jgi:transcriptional regulator with XRE-family HTH domain
MVRCSTQHEPIRAEVHLKLDEDRVRQIRERQGLTLAMLAARAGTSKNTVLSAEHGGDLRPTTAQKIAQALGVTIADLMEEVVLPKAASTTPLLEWALTASDEDFDRRIKTAGNREVTELLQLNNLVPRTQGPQRDRILERVSKIVARLLEIAAYWRVEDDATQGGRAGREAG